MAQFDVLYMYMYKVQALQSISLVHVQKACLPVPLNVLLMPTIKIMNTKLRI